MLQMVNPTVPLQGKSGECKGYTKSDTTKNMTYNAVSGCVCGICLSCVELNRAQSIVDKLKIIILDITLNTS
jgi:hypothetical protein